MISPIRRAFVPFILLALLPGCGGCTGTVSGKVLLGEKPVTSGVVVFTAADGVPYSAVIDGAGRYQLAKLPAGEMKIRVVDSIARPNSGPVKIPDAPPIPVPAPPPPPSIPPQYADLNNGLKYTVRSGTQTHDIELRP